MEGQDPLNNIVPGTDPSPQQWASTLDIILAEMRGNQAKSDAQSATLRTQIEDLRAQVETLRTAASADPGEAQKKDGGAEPPMQNPTPPVVTQPPNTAEPQRPPTGPAEEHQRGSTRRKPLAMGDPFRGDKAYFNAWKVMMEHKLEVDAEFIGNHKAQFMFIWSNLAPAVQKEVSPFMEVGGDGKWDPVHFLRYLTFCYSDNHAKERAQVALESYRQAKNQSFMDFFVHFHQLLAQAGGLGWDDEQKLARLRRSLNHRMREVALHRGVTRDNFDQAVEGYKRIAVDLETADLESKQRPPSPHKGPQRDKDGDVVMTTVGTARTTTAPARKN
jgi:hypothetical protein